MDPDAGDDQRRVVEFIEFRQDWNGRAEEADADEFERFRDVLGAGLWRVTGGDDDDHIIEDAPNFIGDGEVSWVVEDGGARTRVP